MRLYIASSFKNLHTVHLLTARLREAGHVVLDWTDYAPPLPPDMRPDERRAVLDSDSRGHIFAFCTQACASADLVIYLGQSGQDAACEVGIAYGSGVPVMGLTGPLEAPGLILTRAVATWCTSIEHLLEQVEQFEEQLQL